MLAAVIQGNLLVAGGRMIVGIAVAWGNLSGRADTTAESVSKNRADIAAQEARIRAVETSSARQDERMILILDSLRKIESRMDGGAHP